jgi:hypothetical protein
LNINNKKVAKVSTLTVQSKTHTQKQVTTPPPGEYLPTPAAQAVDGDDVCEGGDDLDDTLDERLRRRACIPDKLGTPIFSELPERNDVTMRLIHAQMLKQAVKEAEQDDQPGIIKVMNELEAHFLAIATKWGLSQACCQEILVFCNKLKVDGSQNLLRSYRSMRASADASAATQVEFNRLEVEVDSSYTDTGEDFVTFECLDILSVIVDILSDPDIVATMNDFTQSHEVKVDASGQRVFTANVNTGKWQERTEKVLFGEENRTGIILGPIILFIDGVALTKRGQQGAKPIMMTLACLKPEIRQRKTSWKIAGYMPKLNGQAAKHTAAYQETNAQLYQRSLEFFFAPLCQAYDAGGFFVYALERLWCILPVVAYFTVDSMEATALCGVRAQVNSKHPCRFCLCPGADMNDPDVDVRDLERTVSFMRSATMCVTKLKNTPGERTFGGKMETELSLNAGTYNPLWDIPFGANPRGIYGACPPELLHQYLLGIMKNAYTWTWAVINAQHPVRGSGMSTTACQVDDRFKQFETRHVDPELPVKRFRKGVLKLPYLEGKEYRALLLQFIPVIGVTDLILPQPQRQSVQAVLWLVLELHDLLTCFEGHTESALDVIRRKIVIMMRDFKRVFGVFSPSNCRFMKFHFCLHLLEVLYEWASMRAVDTCFGEAKQRTVRQHFTTTSQRPEHVNRELGNVLARNRHVKSYGAAYGVNLDKRPKRRAVADRLRGAGSDYDGVTGVCVPALVLPMHVRGEGLRKALKEYRGTDERWVCSDVDSAHVTLHKSMRLTAKGSSDTIIFHANPEVYGRPWYDHVSLLCEQPGGKLDKTGARVGVGGGHSFWAGRLQTFVCLHVEGQLDRLLALVQLYGVKTNTRSQAMSKKYIHDMESPAILRDGARGVPFPVMEPCVYNSGKPYLWLVDTEVISKGLWVQRCFDRPSHYWFFTRGEDRSPVAAVADVAGVEEHKGDT